jgi:DNA (cytosine-5)-methyltransferase 1
VIVMSIARPIAIDLFAGAGGMSLGFEQAGYDVRVAVDVDPIHCATHDYNFGNCRAICADIAFLDARRIRIEGELGNAAIEVVFGGAPCQGFSMIGKRALDDPRNKLVGHFVRLVAELEAKYFVFENVRGLTVGEHRRFLDEIILAFEERGYDVVGNYKVLNAAHFGVPQDRHRLFLFGARRGMPLPAYPARTHAPAGSNDRLVIEAEGPSVWDAIGDLPEVERFVELLDRDWTDRADYGAPSDYASRLRDMSRDPENFGHPRSWNRSVLTSSLRAKHTELSRSRFRSTAFGKTEPVSRFHKLDPDGVCNTLRAETASDRGAFTSPRPIHPYTPRCITVREAARLHAYPDWFRFHVTKWHGFRQIGNSVPPLLARAVASQVFAVGKHRANRGGGRVELGTPGLLALDMSAATARYAVPPDIVPKRMRRSGTDVPSHGTLRHA